MSEIDPELIAVYHNAHYKVDAPGAPFVLRIDQFSAALAEMFVRFDVDRAAFLTAWNPGSVCMPMEDNVVAQRALTMHLRERGLHWIRGAGEDPDERHPPEPSVLVLGMPLATASALARRFGQNALVHAAADAIPRLILLR